MTIGIIDNNSLLSTNKININAENANPSQPPLDKVNTRAKVVIPVVPKNKIFLCNFLLCHNNETDKGIVNIKYSANILGL